MKKKLGVKPVAMTLILAIMAGMVFTGCDSKKKVDYGLDENSDMEDSGALLVSKLDVPESYNGDVKGIDSATGLTSVKIEAESISVPDTDKMSVVHCEKNVIDSDYKKRICETFLDVNEGIYVYDWEKPYKGDLENQIEKLQGYAEHATDDDTKAMYEEIISEYQSELRTASDERKGAGEYTDDCFVGYRDGHMWQISFETDENYRPGFEISLFDEYITYRPKDDAVSANCYSSEYNNGRTLPDNSAKISKEEAINEGLDFLISCGIKDIVQTDCNDNMWEYYDSSDENVGVELDGYVITYKKGVDGVPAYTPMVYNLDALNTVTADGMGDISYNAVDEVYNVTVDDSGILHVSATDAVRATGEKEENVDLLSWNEILDALPAAVNSFYSENKTSYSEITFNDVRLTYYKVKDGDGFKYVPVWAFTECSLDLDGSNSDLLPPTQLIMIDAVDGSLIDLKSALSESSI